MRELGYATEITDERIGQIKTIEKQITNPYAKLVCKPGHLQLDYEVTLAGDSKMHLNIFKRQSTQIPQNFSCGIRLGKHILARYNGHHTRKHLNLPGYEYKEIPPYTCHIHEASEQALKAGKKLEHNAIPTKRYNDIAGAWRCLVSDHNVIGIGNLNPFGML